MSKNDAVVSISEMNQYNDKHPNITFRPHSRQEPAIAGARPPMTCRRTTNASAREIEVQQQTPFERFFSGLMANDFIRYTVYWLPIAAVLAIPTVLFFTIKRNHTIFDQVLSTTVNGKTISQQAKIHTKGLFVWLELVWGFLWISKIIASMIPFVFQVVSGLVTSGARKYALVLGAVQNPLSFFIWAVLVYVSFPVIYAWDQETHNLFSGSMAWLSTFHKVLKVSVGMAALWLAEKMIVQLVSVNYHKRKLDQKIRQSKQITKAVVGLYAASLQIFPEHCAEFMKEDFDIHHSNDVQKVFRDRSVDAKTMRLLGELRGVGDRMASAWSAMVSDLTGRKVVKPTSEHAVVVDALETEKGSKALALRIFKSLAPPGAESISEQDLVDELGERSDADPHFIFAQLDRDRNGDVSLEEMTLLFIDLHKEREGMWKNAIDIQSAIKVLDIVLSFIVFILVVFFYAAFFSKTLQTSYTGIWSTVSGGAFAMATVTAEFMSSCFLIFIKHPYDVYDRVNISGVEYDVKKISLMYTVFLRVDNGTLVQISNNALPGLWIENVTRSGVMKERLTFSVSSGTSFNDIEQVRALLEEFVREDENRRHFQPNVDIQLLSVGDLKQLDLRVEILHKSNWADEQRRAERRSRFMCGLLSAMRKANIDAPGGLGSIGAAKAAAVAEGVEGIPSEKAVTAISSGLEILKSLRPRSVAAVDDTSNVTTQRDPSNETTWRQSVEYRPTNYPAARPGAGFI